MKFTLSFAFFNDLTARCMEHRVIDTDPDMESDSDDDQYGTISYESISRGITEMMPLMKEHIYQYDGSMDNEIAKSLYKNNFYVNNWYDKYYVIAFAINYTKFSIYSKDCEPEVIKWREDDKDDPIKYNLERHVEIYYTNNYI